MHVAIDTSISASCSLVVAGAGNIGSQLLPLVARIPEVGRVVIVDRDVVEAKNVGAQAFASEDVGAAKAVAQAARLRRIRPALDVVPLVAPLEDLPRGTLRADLILGALDSRGARRVLGEIAWRLGVPLLDAGVEATRLLARASAYDPHAPGGPCLQCAWSDAEYRALEQSYPCSGAGERPPPQAPPTGAPAALGALAASLLALEAARWLRGSADRHLAAGQEVMIEGETYASQRSALRRFARCRFDHQAWAITRLADGPDELTLTDALALPGDRHGATLAVEGQRFALDLSCASCGSVGERHVPRLLAARSAAERRCTRCGRDIVPGGFDLTESIDASMLDAPALRLPLRAFGLRPHEIVSVTRATGTSHYELAAGGERNEES